MYYILYEYYYIILLMNIIISIIKDTAFLISYLEVFLEVVMMYSLLVRKLTPVNVEEILRLQKEKSSLKG